MTKRGCSFEQENDFAFFSPFFDEKKIRTWENMFISCPAVASMVSEDGGLYDARLVKSQF